MPARANAAAWDGAADTALLDLSAVAGLRGVAHEDGSWRIGAGTTWADLREPRSPSFVALNRALLALDVKRVEVVPLRDHGEAAHVAPVVPLADRATCPRDDTAADAS